MSEKALIVVAVLLPVAVIFGLIEVRDRRGGARFPAVLELLVSAGASGLRLSELLEQLQGAGRGFLNRAAVGALLDRMREAGLVERLPGEPPRFRLREGVTIVGGSSGQRLEGWRAPDGE